MTMLKKKKKGNVKVMVVYNRVRAKMPRWKKKYLGTIAWKNDMVHITFWNVEKAFYEDFNVRVQTNLFFF